MPDSPSPEGLFIRLYLDRHVNIQLARDLGELDFDVLTTQNAGMDEATDSDQLRYAAGQNRAIFTFNIRGLAPLHHEWIAEARFRSGIIVSRQLSSRHYGLMLRRMNRLLNQLTADEMRCNFVHLEQFK